jgi:hypothetical protein
MRRVTIVAMEKKELLYILSVLEVLALQHAKCMVSTTLSFVACPAVQYFSTLPHKRHDFRETVIEHKMRVLILCTGFV